MLGYHLIIDLYDCSCDRLDDIGFAETALRKIVDLTGSKALASASHRFSPQGITVALIISASHVTFHSWPEWRFAAIDLFVCSNHLDIPAMIDSLKGDFGSSRETFTLIGRGVEYPL
jgi:S-adenosylmethionine decarboxylase proenzyme